MMFTESEKESQSSDESMDTEDDNLMENEDHDNQEDERYGIFRHCWHWLASDFFLKDETSS